MNIKNTKNEGTHKDDMSFETTNLQQFAILSID